MFIYEEALCTITQTRHKCAQKLLLMKREQLRSPSLSCRQAGNIESAAEAWTQLLHRRAATTKRCCFLLCFHPFALLLFKSRAYLKRELEHWVTANKKQSFFSPSWRTLWEAGLRLSQIFQFHNDHEEKEVEKLGEGRKLKTWSVWQWFSPIVSVGFVFLELR